MGAGSAFPKTAQPLQQNARAFVSTTVHDVPAELYVDLDAFWGKLQEQLQGGVAYFSNSLNYACCSTLYLINIPYMISDKSFHP